MMKLVAEIAQVSSVKPAAVTFLEGVSKSCSLAQSAGVDAGAFQIAGVTKKRRRYRNRV